MEPGKFCRELKLESALFLVNNICDVRDYYCSHLDNECVALRIAKNAVAGTASNI